MSGQKLSEQPLFQWGNISPCAHRRAGGGPLLAVRQRLRLMPKKVTTCLSGIPEIGSVGACTLFMVISSNSSNRFCCRLVLG